MGRVVVNVTVENFDDRRRAQLGEIAEAEVRRVTVPALVDTGATFMCMPKSLVDQLGLSYVKDYVAKTVTGPLKLALYAPAWIETQKRFCVTEVLALPEGRHVLLGQIPLEMMDWWVDVSSQKLAGNPEHGGQWQVEV